MIIDDEVLSSEDEQERQEEEKNQFTLTVTLPEGSPKGVKNILVTPVG